MTLTTRVARTSARLLWRLRWIGAAVPIGLAIVVPLLGLRRIDPTNLAWLGGDPATGYIGWAFYRREPCCRLPLTWSDRLGDPLGVSISWLDSIPLVAVLLRPLSGVLPDPFQYLGLWACLCFVLQAYFALRIGGLLFRGDPLFVLGTGLLLAGAPAVMWRIFGHYALTSHWLLLASLWGYLRDTSRVSAWRWFIPLGVVPVLAATVTPYLSFLCLLVAFAGIGRLLLERRCKPIDGAYLAAMPCGGVVASLTLFGFVIPGVGLSGYEGAGYGFFSMDLLAPINPMSYGSVLIPGLPVASYGQYEGYNYLGLGVIALWVLNLGRGPRGLARLVTRKTAPLIVVGVICTLAAASSTVTIGSMTVAALELPRSMQGLVNAFRASGRLFWPVHYLLILTAVVATYRGWRRPYREILLAGALLVQVADLAELRRQVRASLDVAQAVVSPLRSPRWRELRGDHERLVVLPAWECDPVRSPGGSEGFAIFGLLAAEQGIATNSYHAGRMTREQRRTHCSEIPAELMGRDRLDPRTAYVVDDEIMIAWGLGGMTSHRCERTDGFNLCTHAPDGNGPGPAWTARLSSHDDTRYAVGQPLDFRHSGNAAPYLWLGWSRPEAWGTWSEWEEASLLVRPDLDEPTDLMVVATLRAYVNDRHRRLRVSIVANDRYVGRWDFDSGHPSLERRVLIPAAVLSAGPALHLRFQVSRPVSPASLGLSDDDRLLGIGLERLLIAPVN